MKQRKRFALLDRDGTILVEKNYLASADQVHLLPGCIEGLKAFQAAGFGLILITNQSGIGRGYFTENALDQIHGRLKWLLASEGIQLDAIFFCPHTPDDNCRCRKPLPGLVERAAAEFKFDPSEAVMIGDKECDVELGRRCGATTILVRSGYGAEHERRGVTADYVCDDLKQAAEAILSPNPKEIENCYAYNQ